MEMTKDMRIVDANNALAQAQLEAKRVDAIMTWEPAATAILKRNPDVRVILKGDDAWKAVTGNVGWELDLVIRTDFLEKNPGALPRVLKMYQDAANFVRTNPEEADTIVTSGKYASKGIEPGNVLTGVKSGRLIYDVQPTWDPAVNAEIWKMLDAGLKYNQIPALPDKQAVLDRAPAR
jgi:ABC-type nitrate/sulfonate/bicarbonate transport system substrate-binding protein